MLTSCADVTLAFTACLPIPSRSTVRKRYSSDRLYLEGGNAGVTCEDVINKRTLPHALQEELHRSRGQDVVSASGVLLVSLCLHLYLVWKRRVFLVEIFCTELRISRLRYVMVHRNGKFKLDQLRLYIVGGGSATT